MRADSRLRSLVATTRLDRILDILLAPIVLVGLTAARLLRRIGSHRTPVASAIYDRLGVLPVIDDYYEPLVTPDRHLRRSLADPRDLPGVDLRVPAQLELLSKLRFADELSSIPMQPEGGLGPYYLNDSYSFGDAEILYSMVRHGRPDLIVEVGSGNSTRFVRAALDRNLHDMGGVASRHVCIEPYEMPWLEHTGAEVLRSRVEDVPLATFDRLGAGDMLLIDSSHVIRPQGDVLAEYLSILPRLAPGVLVHVHDVFTPRDYPDEWVRRRRRLWNEQYLLEAFLTHNDDWEVVLALNLLANDHAQALGAACPMFERHGGQPGAFWLRRK